MAEMGGEPQTSATPAQTIPPAPLDYLPAIGNRRTRWGWIALFTSIFPITFMATSYAMYRNVLGFDNRPIQLWIAWASIALGCMSILLALIALIFRRGVKECAALVLAILYWIIVAFLK